MGVGSTRSHALAAPNSSSRSWIARFALWPREWAAEEEDAEDGRKEKIDKMRGIEAGEIKERAKERDQGRGKRRRLN